MNIGINSRLLTGAYFGVILTPAYVGQKLVPRFRRAYSTREVGPIVTSEASEEDSFIVYELVDHNSETGKFFVQETSHPTRGWALKGKSIIPFSGMVYFDQTNPEDGFNSSNSIKTVHYPLRGDETTFIALAKNEDVLFVSEPQEDLLS